MVTIKPLTAPEMRAFTRKHARLLAVLLDTLPCRYSLNYDEAVAITARLLVDHGPVFCEIVSLGTGLTDAEVQSTPWPTVVKYGCEIIEETREFWRLAWPNGFLQAIVSEELRPFSRIVQANAQ